MEPINYELHTFHSPEFQNVVDDAIRFFDTTPMHELPPPGPFVGSGVYSLYYLGGYGLYAEIGSLNRDTCVHPIYVGKAVPPGWRTARTKDTETPDLYRRLGEHARSIHHANNLDVADFRCRFMILSGTEGDLLVPVEAELIRRYRPLWNIVVDGFGNHDPGAGRYNQAPSEWDTLHPGRPWVERLSGKPPDIEEVIHKVQQFLP